MQMKLFKVALCAGVATFAMAGAAAAAEVSFNVGIANEYVFRGVKQTSDQVQVFGGADATFDGGFYAGTWISNVGPSWDNGFEYDIYGGWKTDVGPVALDLGLIYYGYNNSTYSTITDDLNTLEGKIAGSVPAGPFTVGAAAYYSADAGGSDEDSLYLELNAAYTFEDRATVSAAVGQYDCDCLGGGVDSYTTYNIGVTVPVTEKLSIDARYIGNDDDAQSVFGASTAPESIWVATLKATF